jgi:hypothetical protein
MWWSRCKSTFSGLAAFSGTNGNATTAAKDHSRGPAFLAIQTGNRRQGSEDQPRARIPSWHKRQHPADPGRSPQDRHPVLPLHAALAVCASGARPRPRGRLRSSPGGRRSARPSRRRPLGAPPLPGPVVPARGRRPRPRRDPPGCPRLAPRRPRAGAARPPRGSPRRGPGAPSRSSGSRRSRSPPTARSRWGGAVGGRSSGDAAPHGIVVRDVRYSHLPLTDERVAHRRRDRHLPGHHRRPSARASPARIRPVAARAPGRRPEPSTIRSSL